ncbi:hypothetical protein J6590_048336 [Homalodisca vitripennis]|nr:hypothetical protein J6590_048336 [Homalodisca vitripennis]
MLLEFLFIPHAGKEKGYRDRQSFSQSESLKVSGYCTSTTTLDLGCEVARIARVEGGCDRCCLAMVSRGASQSPHHYNFKEENQSYPLKDSIIGQYKRNFKTKSRRARPQSPASASTNTDLSFFRDDGTQCRLAFQPIESPQNTAAFSTDHSTNINHSIGRRTIVL